MPECNLQQTPESPSPTYTPGSPEYSLDISQDESQTTEIFESPTYTPGSPTYSGCSSHNSKITEASFDSPTITPPGSPKYSQESLTTESVFESTEDKHPADTWSLHFREKWGLAANHHGHPSQDNTQSPPL